eukprot:CAMPEP_0117653292 /NCGR_PEP_ID=MMETSP0804-20121206/3109_1 /TAXON_ID=1074897 /ORGANISM="Tetraselmis astigmatica, Strain CCMP880" /LENGTH=99 /DNA_ID=CAMNT_0005459449 /DNA_START=298 /DNA_END=597 /DNA_ORIENTATION=+
MHSANKPFNCRAPTAFSMCGQVGPSYMEGLKGAWRVDGAGAPASPGPIEALGFCALCCGGISTTRPTGNDMKPEPSLLSVTTCDFWQTGSPNSPPFCSA